MLVTDRMSWFYPTLMTKEVVFGPRWICNHQINPPECIYRVPHGKSDIQHKLPMRRNKAAMSWIGLGGGPQPESASASLQTQAEIQSTTAPPPSLPTHPLSSSCHYNSLDPGASVIKNNNIFLNDCLFGRI